MRLALLFSGQGGQTPAHWQQLAGSGNDALLTALAAALPAVLGEVAPDPATLAVNRVAQPFIFSQQMALWAALRERLPRPVCAAGYSLGEMAACCAAGAYSEGDGVALCATRARLMDAAAPGDYGMLAVLGLDEAVVLGLAADAGLAVAIRNGPRHLVLAGPRDDTGRIGERFLKAGATRVLALAVRTPSHTAWLAEAATAFARHLAAVPDGRLAFPVFSAIDATPARTVQPALAALASQLAAPLDWAACQQAVSEMQPDAVLEIGPGNALARLFAEHAPAIPVRATDDFRSVDGVLRWLDACGA